MRTYFRPAVGTKKVTSLTTVDLLAAYTHCTKRGVGARIIHHAAEPMRNVLRRAVKWEVITLVPLRPSTLTIYKSAEAQVDGTHGIGIADLVAGSKKPNTPVRCAALRTAYSTFYPAVAFAPYTGARLGEVMAVRWQDVDARQRIITSSVP